MNTRPLSPSALLSSLFLGCLLLVASCATPTPSTPTGTGGTGVSCGGGQMNCNGVCTDVTTTQNCGTCGKACGNGMSCQAGSCVCSAGLLNCNNSCVASDSSHCGSCTNACPGGQVCSNNACSTMCSGGQTMCAGGACANTASDNGNCGSCGTICSGGSTCVNSQCACASPQVLCNGACITTNSNQNCGSCGNACPGGTTCTNSACVSTTGTAGNGGGGTTGTAGNGAGTAGNGAGTAGSSAGNSGTAGRGGSGTAGTTGTAGTGGSGNGNPPPGYWIYTDNSPSYTWNGCAWTGIDTVTVAPNRTTVSPMDFTTQSGTSGPYHVSGKVGQDPMYNGVALLGFNLNQAAAGASCVYDPTAATRAGPPAITFPAGPTGIAVNFSKTSSTGVVRIQIQGVNGATDPMNRWCYGLTQVQGKDFAPFSRFFTSCWNDDGTGKAIAGQSIGNKYNGEPISAIVFLVPGTNNANLPYDFTVNSFALGTSSADAPDGGVVGHLSGTIGGTGTDADFQRVKVTGGTPTKSYIIQNNNWGNPSGTDQTITYMDNSFTITKATGNGSSAPASFPSIYIGANGNVMSGAYSTIGDDNLPKQISAIQSVQTKMTVNRASGDMNVTYDVWFNAAAPNLSSYPNSGYAEYKDGVSGFVMVWFYKPPNHQPIGSSMRTANIGGKAFNVWVGPRGSGANPNAPVVSYVAQTPFTTWSFDLKPFIVDAASNGIQSSWYLTDVFGGAEIWTGADSMGFSVSEFTAVVQ